MLGCGFLFLIINECGSLLLLGSYQQFGSGMCNTIARTAKSEMESERVATVKRSDDGDERERREKSGSITPSRKWETVRGKWGAEDEPDRESETQNKEERLALAKNVCVWIQFKTLKNVCLRTGGRRRCWRRGRREWRTRRCELVERAEVMLEPRERQRVRETLWMVNGNLNPVFRVSISLLSSSPSSFFLSRFGCSLSSVLSFDTNSSSSDGGLMRVNRCVYQRSSEHHPHSLSPPSRSNFSPPFDSHQRTDKYTYLQNVQRATLIDPRFIEHACSDRGTVA